MKIGIVTLYTPDGTNYGNCLQAFACNTYVKKVVGNKGDVITLPINNILANRLYTNKKCIRHIRGILSKCFKFIFSKRQENQSFLRNRTEKFIDFGKEYIDYSSKSVSVFDLADMDFDVYIVGSDVVWGQTKGMINRVRFLDFPKKGLVKKISYAASFGQDWIPKENVAHVRRCLMDFDAISVREGSSVQLLNEFGINAVHVLDPTLLLSSSEWKCIEKSVKIHSRYVFAYILGCDQEMRKNVMDWAHKKDFLVVCISYASGEYNNVDSAFGDIQISDCSPQNWLWLIDHSEYVITDSFHGTVFSTIFHKKFVVLERFSTVNINNRMTDYLKTIEQSDKMISFLNLSRIDEFTWDWERIDYLLNEKRLYSIDFLKQSLRHMQ